MKKSPAFSNYFKSQSEKLKEFPEPEDNVDNYKKILKNVLNTIGVAIQYDIKDDNSINF